MLSLTVAIRALIITDKGPVADDASVPADSGSAPSFVKVRLWGVFVFIPCELASWTHLYSWCYGLHWTLIFQRGRMRRFNFQTLWQGQIFWKEGIFVCFDLHRSKSRPLTFLLTAASCSALIKLRKHPNQQAALAHINPPSLLPRLCRLCNSAYYSFKALSQNCFFCT